MEGWFWRFTDVSRGRVVVALCGINRHPGGDWATVAVAAHPGGVVRSAAVDGAQASDRRYRIHVGDVLQADERGLRIDLEDVQLSVALHDLVGWPMRLGGGGIFSMVPYLGQYWHPHALGGRATGRLVIAGDTAVLDDAAVYAEKNWGAGFPDRWWWGQAQGFSDPTIGVAFGGGRLTAGPLGLDVTGCVLRLGTEVVRFSPPVSWTRASTAQGAWRVDARRPGWRMSIDGSAGHTPPAVLPVPLPAARRNVDRDLEHLAGRLRLRVWRRGRRVLDEESVLAGLEVGSTQPDEFARLAVEHAVR